MVRWFLLSLAMGFLVSSCGLAGPSDSNAGALQALQEAGSDLSKQHPFDFYIYHPEQSGAAAICEQLAQQGFQTTLRQGSLPGEWLCLATLSMLPTLENLTEIQSRVSRLAADQGGNYDGWETVVVP